MIQPSISATYDGKPLEVLNHLIDLRVREMRQMCRDSLVGTAITCLKSIRAMTRKANSSTRSKSEIVDTGLYGGFSRTLWRRCFRQGVSKWSPRVDIDGRVVWLTTGVKSQAQRHVYKVTPEHESVEPYYVVAPQIGIAKAYDDNLRRRRISVYGVLAQGVLGQAMHATSTKQSAGAGGSPKCNAAAMRMYRVYMNALRNTDIIDMKDWDAPLYWIFRDDLQYALRAVKGGQAGVNLALMKAANKTMGLIRQYLHNHFGTDKGFTTPFPDIKREY